MFMAAIYGGVLLAREPAPGNFSREALKQGLLIEAQHAGGVAGEIGRQQLQRDLAPESHLGGEPHLAHPARAERTHDFVGVEPGTGLERHERAGL